MVHHHKVDCFVKRSDCSVVVKVKVTERFRIPVTVHLDNISSAAEPFVTKLGTVMQHHRPKCHSRRLVYCLQVQGHSEGPLDQTTISTELLLFLQPNLDGSLSYDKLECFV